MKSTVVVDKDTTVVVVGGDTATAGQAPDIIVKDETVPAKRMKSVVSIDGIENILISLVKNAAEVALACLALFWVGSNL